MHNNLSVNKLKKTDKNIVYTELNNFNKLRRLKKVDMWQELKKRWLVLGVLVSVTLAVLSPRIGAPGGVLRVEYLKHIPKWYIYYVAGGRWRGPADVPGGPNSSRAPPRLLLLSAVHYLFVAPALLIPIVYSLQMVGLDHRILQGAVFSMSSGPCAWLSLSMSTSRSAPALTALHYALALALAPVHMLLLCGRAAFPPSRYIITTTLSALFPFSVGALRAHSEQTPEYRKVSALVLLYAECCELLREAEGSLYVIDVLVTLVLEWSWVCVCVGGAWAWWRAGVLGAAPALTLALCAAPRALDNGWDGVPCSASGLSRLPAVFLAPAQALLLAALSGPDDDDELDDEGYDDIA